MTGPAPTLVGTLGTNYVADVDIHGAVSPTRDASWSLDWWIGADDRWHRPAAESVTRQTVDDGFPIVETSVRIPSGDARQTVYGVGGAHGLLAYEIENTAPVPFVVTLVVQNHRRRSQRVTVRDATAFLGDAPVLGARIPPARWAHAGSIRELDAIVTGGSARADPFVPFELKPGAACALLYPVTHRTTAHFALSVAPAPTTRAARAAAAGIRLDPADLVSADDVRNGWTAQLDRGLRVRLPDQVVSRDATHARVQAMLRATVDPDAADAAALEDWGLDPEAVSAWERLSMRDRSRASRRAAIADPLDALAAVDGSELLLTLRDVLVHEEPDGSVDLLRALPPAWLGGAIEVHDAPLRDGARIGFAVRWHGARPAILWALTGGPPRPLRSSGLDPAWSSAELEGDALLDLPAVSGAELSRGAATRSPTGGGFEFQ
ncbi:MAG: hypothetical protein JWL73_3760 [Actinomycetia bacterium]|nr:hypothetical protein [Actinomycetes bacterium]